MVDIVASGDGRQALACLAPLASFALLMRRELGPAPHLPALSPGSRAALAVPEGIEPYTAVALGWPGDPSLLDEGRRERERAPRVRLPLAEVAPRSGWGG